MSSSLLSGRPSLKFSLSGPYKKNFADPWSDTKKLRLVSFSECYEYDLFTIGFQKQRKLNSECNQWHDEKSMINTCDMKTVYA